METLFPALWLVLQSMVGSTAESGSITGAVGPQATLTAVTAIDRTSGKKIVGAVEPETGKVRIDDLPFDKSFDVIIDFKPAAGVGLWRLEGVSMKVPRSEYEEEQPLSAE